MSRFGCCLPMMSSIKNFDVHGSTNPDSRLTTINAKPIESDTRCSAISWRASFHARVLSYLAIPEIYRGTAGRGSSARDARRKVFLKREPPNAPPGRGENRVGDGGCDRRHRRLAQS